VRLKVFSVAKKWDQHSLVKGAPTVDRIWVELTMVHVLKQRGRECVAEKSLETN